MVEVGRFIMATDPDGMVSRCAFSKRDSRLGFSLNSLIIFILLRNDSFSMFAAATTMSGAPPLSNIARAHGMSGVYNRMLVPSMGTSHSAAD
jgi:hypothetical protein